METYNSKVMRENLIKKNPSDHETKRGETSKVIAFRIPASLRASLYELCQQTGKSPAYILRHALAAYLKNNKEDKRRDFINTRLQGWQAASPKVDDPVDNNIKPKVVYKKKYRHLQGDLYKGE